ncbi:MAG TPA: PDZ domain-containing protein, partial [bacterium]|nr:PDZ domain-containing protein [bacterium]
VRPRLGVSYLTINDDLALEKDLPVNQGALISANNDQPAVIAGSPAERAGILPGDIILEINAQKLNEQNSLLQIIQKYQPNQKIGLKIQRGDKKIIVQATLDEFPNR